jgi:hypothetical protein
LAVSKQNLRPAPFTPALGRDRHKHPDDLARVKALLKQSSAPFSSRHRIRTTTGETRKVVVVGAAVADPDGRIVATQGFYVDVTEAFHADLQQEVGNELQVIVAQ